MKEVPMLFADLFTLNLNIASGFFTLNIDIGKGRAFADFLSITVSLARYTITYNLLDLLLILGISIVAAVLVEKIARQTTPGGFFWSFSHRPHWHLDFHHLCSTHLESRLQGPNDACPADHFLHRGCPLHYGSSFLQRNLQEEREAGKGIGK